MTKTIELMGTTYRVNDKGIIIEPGKFEGEPYWVVHFWSFGVDGGADEDVNGVWKFFIGDDDRKFYPDLDDYNTLYIWEDEQGFVHHDADWRTDTRRAIKR